MKRKIWSVVFFIVGTVTSKFIEKAITMIPSVKWIWQTFVVELWPLWVGLLCIIAYWLIVSFRDFRKEHKELKTWVLTRHYESYHQWLERTKIDGRGFYDMAEKSLEGKIVSMLEWWKEKG